MYDNRQEAEKATLEDIEKTKKRIEEIRKLLLNHKSPDREKLIAELVEYLLYNKIYEFCTNGEGHDFREYGHVSEDENISYSAAGSATHHFIHNPIPALAGETLKQIKEFPYLR